MKKFVMAFTLVAIAGHPALAFADEFKAGDRVQGTAAFFMCGAREDLATLRALERQGDAESARKLGTDRCEQGRPGYQYLVMETADDAVCIRATNPYCLWAQRSAVRVVGPQG
jgi:hypothetical protein